MLLHYQISCVLSILENYSIVEEKEEKEEQYEQWRSNRDLLTVRQQLQDTTPGNTRDVLKYLSAV